MKFFTFIVIVIVFGVSAISTTKKNDKINWNKVETISPFVIVPSFDEIKLPKINRGQISGRIFAGNLVPDIKKISYQAGLLLEKYDEDKFWCGASIISDRCILSAAHCFQDVAKGTIYLGTKNNDYLDDSAKLIDFTRSNIIVHDKFNPRNFHNDIAVVCVDPFELTDAIQPVEIIKRKDEMIDNKLGIASGWGHTKDTDDSAGERLRYTNITILPNQNCDSQLNSVYKREPYETDDLICTANPKLTGSCKGDSGGPLVSLINDKQTLIGVFSFVTYSREDRSNCERTTARVYQRLSNYRTWICLKAKVCA